MSASPDASAGPSPYVVEPHHLVFSYCDAFFAKALTRDLHELPIQLRKKFFRKLATNRQPFIVDRAQLLGYLDLLLSKLNDRLQNHSAHFWLFLYRRIKPVLSPHHDNITDANTTLLVRSIVELAIFKFAALDHSEFEKQSTVKFEKQWGGYLKLAVEQISQPTRNDIIALLTEHSAADTLIPVEFRPADYRAIYAAEGLAYEYWLATAKLRSVGKGLTLWFNPVDGQLIYEPNKSISEAIGRFDKRLTGVTFFPTLLGTTTPDSSEQRFHQIFSAHYNVHDVDLTDLFEKLGFPAKSQDGDNLANFLPSFLPVEEFISQHVYVDEPFRILTGFGLSPFLYILWAVSNLALVPNSALNSELNFGFLTFNLLRRGYTIYETEDIGSEIRNRIQLRNDLADSKKREIFDCIEAVVKYIALAPEIQKKISPWSGGPRPILIRTNKSWLIDTVGIIEFLRRMFTGIRDDGAERGIRFEETVRLTVEKIRTSAGFSLGPRKIYQNGRLIDEIDLMVVRSNVVFVCECFSMWMPLNFEIGESKTIAARTEQIDAKIDQATATCQFLDKNRVGSNYDFREVEKFVPIVVSPFVEWLPEPSDRYWLSKTEPRVMTLDELVRFFNHKV